MSSTGVQRQVTLAPAPDSARTARRLVAEVLATAGADSFVDTATLLTSELVTNGIVHAHTELHVLVDATPTWVRVEVVDGNPQLPSRRDYDESASTGRGMEMVELLADDFGVESLEQEGKRVWFRLGESPGTPSVGAEPSSPAIDVVGSFADAHAHPTEVRLIALPVTLYCAWQQHAEALLREATLVALEDSDSDQGDYPLASRALAALADAAQEVFALRDAGAVVADVVLALAPDSVPWFPILRDMLARATEMSSSGQLLVPPSLPEIVAVRRWVCDEVARQSAGLAPTPWAVVDPDDALPADTTAPTLDEVRWSEQSLVAADASNRIVAVSAGAGELLGWVPADLEGRRLVTIIPPHLRDRHIAGFTRLLLGGTSQIVGRSVPVPALRRDGSQVDIDLLIEHHAEPQAPSRNSRGLFVATMTPR